MNSMGKIKIFILELFLWVSSLIVLIPYLLVVLTSLKTSKEAGLFQLNLPSEIHFLDNYKIVFEKGNVLLSFYNSIVITAVSVVIILVSSALLSFYIARVKSRFSSFLYVFFVMGMMAPISLVTTYQLLESLGLIDTFIGVVFIYASIMIPFAAFIFVGFVKTIPMEMDEAAIIDGSGSFRLFFSIILPLLKPVIFTNLILVFMAIWNDAHIILFFLSNSDSWTMPLNIYRFFSYYRADWNYIFGSVFLTTIPVLILYMFGQKYIIAGMVSGAVKG